MEKYGAKGWDYDSLLPYFKKSESFRSTSSTTDQRGTNGEIPIEPVTVGPVGKCFMQANNEMEIPSLDLYDYNNERQHGVCSAQCTTEDGLRCDGARSFLLPIFQTRKNLTVCSLCFC